MSPENTQIVDDIIMSHTNAKLRKVAMVIALSHRECEARSMQISTAQIWERLATLVAEGKLEAFGDITNWRFSEVRLLP